MILLYLALPFWIVKTNHLLGARTVNKTIYKTIAMENCALNKIEAVLLCACQDLNIQCLECVQIVYAIELVISLYFISEVSLGFFWLIMLSKDAFGFLILSDLTTPHALIHLNLHPHIFQEYHFAHQWKQK